MSNWSVVVSQSRGSNWSSNWGVVVSHSGSSNSHGGGHSDGLLVDVGLGSNLGREKGQKLFKNSIVLP